MKILASDFDNTLLFYDGMREKDLKAIKQFQAQGNLFGVCTGRNLAGIQIPSKNYDIKYDFYICTSGSHIFDKDQNIIQAKKISMEIVKEIREIVGKDIYMSMTYQNETYHINKDPDSKYRGKIINDINEINAYEIDSCSFHYLKGQIKEARIMIEKILKQLGHKISAFQNNEHIDITAFGCSKGNGIDIIKEYYQVQDHDMIGIGDSFNDLPMFEHVGCSYTFDYSDQEVKQKADHIVSSISECINELLK